MKRATLNSGRTVEQKKRPPEKRKPIRALIVITAIVVLAVSTTLLAGSGGRSSAEKQLTEPRADTSAREIAPASLAASSPAKEYVYVGGRLIATEEPSSGCTVSISPPSASFAAAASPGGGPQAGTIAVTAGCAWTATSNSGFITIASGASGSGNGTVGYSVAVHTGTTLRNGTITVGGQTFTVFQSMQFSDVPTSDPFYPFIGKLAARGVSVGCGTGCNPNGLPCFCPTTTVTRSQMAVFMLKGMGIFNPPTPGSQLFTDVPPGHFAYAFIDKCATLGIITGCTANTFCPDDVVTRADMAVFVERALGVFSPPTPSSQKFFDVQPSHPAYAFIDDFANRGITAGCGNGCGPPQGMTCYCPNDSLTRGQMAVFLVKAFNL